MISLPLSILIWLPGPQSRLPSYGMNSAYYPPFGFGKQETHGGVRRGPRPSKPEKLPPPALR